MEIDDRCVPTGCWLNEGFQIAVVPGRHELAARIA